jgi:hypothetical protein
MLPFIEIVSLRPQEVTYNMLRVLKEKQGRDDPASSLLYTDFVLTACLARLVGA